MNETDSTSKPAPNSFSVPKTELHRINKIEELFVPEGLLPKRPVSLAKNYHAAARVETSGFGVAGVGPGVDFVDEKALDVANKLTREPLVQAEVADSTSKLRHAELLSHWAKDPFFLVVRLQSAPDGTTGGFAKVENVVLAGVDYSVKSPLITTTIRLVTFYVSPVEDNPLVFHMMSYLQFHHTLASERQLLLARTQGETSNCWCSVR